MLRPAAFVARQRLAVRVITLPAVRAGLAALVQIYGSVKRQRQLVGRIHLCRDHSMVGHDCNLPERPARSIAVGDRSVVKASCKIRSSHVPQLIAAPGPLRIAPTAPAA